MNEFAPAFSPAGPYSKSVSEDSAVGVTVMQLVATDNDLSDTAVAFTITGGNTDSRFMVDSSTGVVKVMN